MKTEKQVKKLLENYKNQHSVVLSKLRSEDDPDLQVVFLEELRRLIIKINLLKLILGLSK